MKSSPSDKESFAITERAAQSKYLRASNSIRQTPADLLEFAKKAGIDYVGIHSPGMQEVFEQSSRFHQDRSIPVLIEGETGTGKEIIARYIHYGKNPVERPFIAINCAALAPIVFESELFGYEAGTFTGGLKDGKPGKLDLAEGGTLFLDEICELSLELQAKLLRLIQEKEYYRVGGLNIIKSDVRFICSSNQDMEEIVAKGYFRKDLYYRLAVGRILIPPLRERQEEILPMAEAFLSQISRSKGKQYRGFSDEAAAFMLQYSWSGNVRQLRNEIERLVLFHDDPVIKPEHLTIKKNDGKLLAQPQEGVSYLLKPGEIALPRYPFSLDELNNEIMLKALQMHNDNKTSTAQYLGISRSALLYRLKKIGHY
ncbi:RNA polymerase sigma factor 54 interaction domain [Syntrophomonas zehnderi OL-4]|uniref:RNA polymerase sigma factor 54 interaction domain n=1 Tax=Syntrophomonas zehnderi OL-4 TaxID=690567 RepID=A0A0E3W315_9FIRM|nr:sigma-54 dependent transcriptional regulator [Syntrophomonas zehnderi]CFX40015.1 RNA polymerase sigma factor 54 interaction domain [Syntrophomonas zehnderi OL-4]